MSTPVEEIREPKYPQEERKDGKRDDKKEDKQEDKIEEEKDIKRHDPHDNDTITPSDEAYDHHLPGPSDPNRLQVNTEIDRDLLALRSPSAHREQSLRLEDDLALLEAERVASASTKEDAGEDNKSKSTKSISRVRSRRSGNVDEFDEATNPLHEKAAVYNPPEKPNTKLSVFIKKLHQSSFIVRYFTYIAPVVLLLLIPLLVGALAFPNASVGGVELLWFSVWLEIVWLTLWAGRVCHPPCKSRLR